MPEPRPLACILHSGSYERVRFALAAAAAAAAMDRPVTLFFTMGACRSLAGCEGWQRLSAPESAVASDRALRKQGVAGLTELLDACRDLGVRFLVCDMGLRAEGLVREQLRSDLPLEDAGLVGLLADGDAQLLFA